MTRAHSFSGLQWVSGELDEVIRKARDALEEFVEGGGQTAVLGPCVRHLNQVRGVLEMLQLFGAARLAEEMQLSAKALTEQDVDGPQDVAEALMLSMIQLPDYLEKLQSGVRDLPVLLLPSINDLRMSRGSPQLSEADLVVSDWVHAPPDEAAEEQRAEQLRRAAQQFRPQLHKGLLGWFRGSDPRPGQQALCDVFAGLEAQATGEPLLRGVFRAAHAVMAGVLDASIDSSKEVKGVVGRVDRIIKNLGDKGAVSAAAAVQQGLVKDLLQQVAGAQSSHPVIRALKADYHLDSAFPSESELEEARRRQLAPGADTMAGIQAAAVKELVPLKDTLDLYMRGGRSQSDQLLELADPMHRLSNTLDMAGFDDLSRRLRRRADDLRAIGSGESAPDDTLLMGLAGDLLFVESALGHVQQEAGGGSEGPAIHVPPGEMEGVIKRTLDEASVDMAKAKEAIVTYMDSPDQTRSLEQSPRLFHGVAGALRVIGQSGAADVLDQVSGYVEQTLLRRTESPDARALDALADTIIGVEYYMEAVSEDRSDKGQILDIARAAAARLASGETESGDALASLTLSGESTASPEVEPAAKVEAGEPEPAEPLPPEPLLEAVDPEILEIFLEEAREEQEIIQPLFRRWREDPDDSESLGTFRRSFHTLKGSGRLAGAMLIGDFAWSVEMLLNRLIEQTIEASPEVLAYLDDAVAALPELIDAQEAQRAPAIDVPGLMARAQELVEKPVAEPGVPSEPDSVPELPEPEAEAPEGQATLWVEDEELRDIFQTEAREHLHALRRFLEECRELPCRFDDELVRSLHTLAGSARMTDLEPIAVIAKALERKAGDIQALDSAADERFVALLQSGVELMNEMVESLSDEPANQPDTQALLEHIEGYVAAPSEPEPAEPSVAAVVEMAGLEGVESVFPETEDHAVAEAPDAQQPEGLALPTVEVEEFSLDEASADTEPAAGLELPEPSIVTELTIAEASLDSAPPGDEFDSIVLESESEDQMELSRALGEGVSIELEPDAQGEPEEPVSAALDSQATEAGAVEEAPECVPVESEPESAEPAEAEGMAEEVVTELEAITDAAELPEAEPAAAFEALEVDDELREIFLEEAEELLDRLDQGVRNWHEAPDDAEAASELQRTLHTLKGGARLTGIESIGDLSHGLESLIKSAELPARPQVLERAQRAADFIATQIEAVREGRAIPVDAALIAELHGEPVAAAPAPEPAPLEEAPSPSGALPDALLAPLEDEFESINADRELIEIFLEEAEDLLEHLDSHLRDWEEAPGDAQLPIQIKRTLHTLKGSARLAGIESIGDLSHALETLLDGISPEHVRGHASLMPMAQKATDRLADQVEAVRQGTSVQKATGLIGELEFVHEELTVLADGKAVQETAPIAAVSAAPAAVKPEPARPRPAVAQEQVRVRADLLNRLVNNAGEISIYRARLEQQNLALGFNLGELEQTVSRLHDQLRQMEIETEAQILYRYEQEREQGSDLESEFDPLELDRFSTIQQLSRSLIETVNDLASIKNLLGEQQGESETLLLQHARISNDLQDGLLRTRMVPFAQVVPRLQRLVRQTAASLGKRAVLEVYGGEGEMDRGILDRMLAPMEHILRNAVSHGIEAPEKRRTLGKDEVGKVSVYLSREGNDVIITVSDDGAGLNLEAIRKRARETGLLAANADLDDDDVMQLVLEPGFSTVKEVTQISGRGVGTDVVVSEVKQMGGSLEIESQPGRGTGFSIRLPFTLAISEALLVELGEDVFAVPHPTIEGVVRISSEELSDCYAGKHNFTYAGHEYHVRYLSGLMGGDLRQTQEGRKWLPLMLVRSGEHRVAIQVDRILGNRQIVVKSVGVQLSTVRWISGGTILADGRVALILDVSALVRMDLVQSPQIVSASAPVEAPLERPVKVMVVDDSITVRKVTTRLLKRHNMEVLTAKDGVDAVAELQEQHPDVMLLDIEMPRMDGYELARHMRNSSELQDIPIIMITSRSGDKHRNMAMSLGVKRYLGKPYQEGELLDNIYSVLAESEVEA